MTFLKHWRQLITKENGLQKAFSLKMGVPGLWGSHIVVQGDQFTRNPLWRWSPNMISIWRCSGIPACPSLVPHQCLRAGIAHLSRAAMSEQSLPRDTGPRRRSVGREAKTGRRGRIPCCPAPQEARGGGWGIPAIGRPPQLVPSRSCWGRQDLAWQQGRVGWWPF